MQPEERPLQPPEPRRTKNLLTNLAVGGCLGVGCILMLIAPTVVLLAVAAIYYFVGPTAGTIALVIVTVGGVILAILDSTFDDGKRRTRRTIAPGRGPARTVKAKLPPSGFDQWGSRD